MTNADLAAEPLMHLAEFQTNVAAVQHLQMTRQEVDVYHRAVGEVIDLIKAGNVRRRRTRAEIDDDMTGCRDLTANLHLARRHELRVALRHDPCALSRASY